VNGEKAESQNRKIAMAGVAQKKRRGESVLDTDALANKDILFVVFSFFAAEEIARCACVNRAFRRAAQSERLWEAVCERLGYLMLAGETWKASFELTHPARRNWQLRQMTRELARLAAVPLPVSHRLAKERQAPRGRRGREQAREEELPALKRELLTLMGSLETAAAVPTWFANQVDVRITLTTGLQPSHKDTRQLETRFLLNGVHSLVHLVGVHDQYTCPRILYCEQLAGGTVIASRDQADVMGWLGRHSRTAVFPLVFNSFDGPSETKMDNVRALLKLLGKEGVFEPDDFLRALMVIGLESGYNRVDF
jgi:hypothetical protein